jgi:hypothetical protein
MKQVVEYEGVPVGILIPRDGGLAFMAVKYDVMELDGARFPSIAEARSAVGVHVKTRAALTDHTPCHGRQLPMRGEQQAFLS